MDNLSFSHIYLFIHNLIMHLSFEIVCPRDIYNSRCYVSHKQNSEMEGTEAPDDKALVGFAQLTIAD